MPITDYNLMIDRDYAPGQLVTPTGGTIHTRFNNSDNILFFGLGVVTGARNREIVVPSATGGKFEGVLFYTNTFELRNGHTRDAVSGRIGYPPKREVSIIRPGEFAQVAVFVDSATAINDPVFIRHTGSGTTGLPGCFRKDIDTDKADAITRGRFIKAVSAPAAGKMAVSWIEFS